MQITKSSRHSKIAGNFGEMLVLYWLSKYGFECAAVDHTGIDLLARNPQTKELMGISVKSRTRNVGAENEYVKIPTGDFVKIEKACVVFNCVPCIAIVVDAGPSIRVYITSITHLLEIWPQSKSGACWRMRESDIVKYSKDSEIMSFNFTTETKQWWEPNPIPFQ